MNSFMRLGWCRSASRSPIAFVDLKAATLAAQERIYGKEAKTRSADREAAAGV
ncbi:MAG: hypothetical protein H7293_18545 [Candidatus Saccharibacteria bacterium]|nr:hypothetical protein [Rhodoferax sp.]